MYKMKVQCTHSCYIALVVVFVQRMVHLQLYPAKCCGGMNEAGDRDWALNNLSPSEYLLLLCVVLTFRHNVGFQC